MNPISIRFPMTREKTGNRTGPRYRLMPDKTGLHGAAACACSMVSMAIRHRETARIGAAYFVKDFELHRQIERAGMRIGALWARIFAGQIEQTDPRVEAAMAEKTRLVRLYCEPRESTAA